MPRARVPRLAALAVLAAVVMALASGMLARHWPWWRTLAPGVADPATDASARMPSAGSVGASKAAAATDAGTMSPPVAILGMAPVNIGFAQDMSLHHEQALAMARLALSQGSPRVQALAQGIVNQQLREIGAMQGWLMLWDAPATSASDDMRWMRDAYSKSRRRDPVYEQYIDSCVKGQGMPGLATAEQLENLATLRDAAFDARFLALMVRHHQGAVVMARFASEHAEAEPVRAFARTIAAEQRGEMVQMMTLLAVSQRAAALAKR